MLEDNAEVALFSSNVQQLIIDADGGLSLRSPVAMVRDDWDSFFHVDKQMSIFQPSAC